MDMKKGLHLQLFNDGGGEGGTGEGTAAVDNTQQDTAPKRYRNQTDYTKQDVLPPKKEVATEPTKPTEPTEPEGKLSFEELIKGDYKEDYQKEVDRVINKRFAQSKGIEEELEKRKGFDPVLNELATRYNVDPSDPNALAEAIKNDKAHIQAYADDKGVSYDEAKRQLDYQANMKELAMMKEQNRQQEKQYFEEKQRQEFNARLQEQVGATKEMYGDAFDPDVEFESEEFISLVRAGIDVKTAFEVIHKDDLMNGAITKAVADTKKRVVQDIQAKGKRPSENGIESANPGVSTFNPDKLSRKAKEDIERRVARGEKIGVEEMAAYMK